jgi:hypothetical protein
MRRQPTERDDVFGAGKKNGSAVGMIWGMKSVPAVILLFIEQGLQKSL